MTGTKQPTKAELARLRSQCFRVARKLARRKPAMALPSTTHIIGGGPQDCYDDTVDQLGYDPLLGGGRESRR